MVLEALPKKRGGIMKALKKDLIQALKDIRHSVNCALLYKQMQKGKACDILDTIEEVLPKGH